MNILSKLSIKNLRLNKKRTISTIIGIILSVALICAVATMLTSFQYTLIQDSINTNGYYHLQISNVTKNDIKDIKNNRDVKDIYEIKEVGYAKLDGIANKDKPYVHVYSMEEEVFDKLKFEIVKGNMPKNENEIIISEHIINNGKLKLNIGDKVNLKVGTRMLDDHELNQYNPYSEQEVLESTTNHTFKIVGIIKRPEYRFENYGDPGYTVITTNNTDKGITKAYIALNEPKKYKTSIPEILGAKDYNEVISSNEKIKFNNFDINEELLRWEALAFSDSTVNTIYSVAGVVICIIIFTSVFCIRNSFAIATTEKIKMYGMLSSVGATKKQIKQNVIFEGMILGLIGIPLGIIGGLFADFILIKIVNVLLGDFLLQHVDGILFKVSIIPIIIAVVLGFVTIYLSAISSAIKASKVSPIEQLKSTNDIKIKNKKLKTPKIISKVFKTGGVLAYKNLKRSRKKYRTTVISISVSIFIFITMNVFITNAFDTTYVYYKDYDYNIYFSNLREISKEEVNKILSLDNIEEKYMLYDSVKTIKITDLSKVNQYTEHKFYDKLEMNNENEDINEKYVSLAVCALDNETFKSYCKKIGENYEKIKDKAILCDSYVSWNQENDKIKNERRYNYKKNDSIVGTYNGKEISKKIGAISDIKPYGLENLYNDSGYLVVNLEENTDFDFYLSGIYVQSNDTDKLEDDVKYLELGVYIANIEADARAQNSMILVIKIFLYGFITVITLIGVTNIFNTITSNMELRQKEFAMLKSIGMTKKEFDRMINLETLFYGTKSLIYGIIMGLIGTFLMYFAFSEKIDSTTYIPVNPILLSTVFVFILIFIIMKYSIMKINRQNTIETIRKENI